MQNGLLKTFALYLLLLVFGLAAGYAGHARQPDKKHSVAIGQTTKVGMGCHTDIPFLSSDLPQISRANERVVERLLSSLFPVLCIPPFKDVSRQPRNLSSKFQYSVPFKILFPEHAFS